MRSVDGNGWQTKVVVASRLRSGRQVANFEVTGPGLRGRVAPRINSPARCARLNRVARSDRRHDASMGRLRCIMLLQHDCI